MAYYSFENGIQTDTEILFEKSIHHYCELLESFDSETLKHNLAPNQVMQPLTRIDKDDDIEYGLPSYSGVGNIFTPLYQKGSNKQLDYKVNKTFAGEIQPHERNNALYTVGIHNTGMFGVDEKSIKYTAKQLNKLEQEALKVNHPKSWLAKKVAWLRGLYSKILGKMAKYESNLRIDYNDPKKSNFKKAIINVKMVLSSIASSILRLIDRIMNKIQLMSDKD